MSFFCRRRRRGIKRRRVEISFVWFVCLLDLSHVMSVEVCGVCLCSGGGMRGLPVLCEKQRPFHE